MNNPAIDYLKSEAAQRYTQIIHGLHLAQVSFSDDSEHIETDNVAKILRDDVSLYEANSVGSAVKARTHAGDYLHKPVLDLDMDALLVPSSTHGHHHLYIDHEMPWKDYRLLMLVMEHVGLLQPGYVHASITRRESFVRTPWTRKHS